MGNVNTAGPNEAAVISGGWTGGDSKKYVVGGWGWSWWFVSDVERISLNVMTIKPVCKSVETAKGVALTVTGVAQVKIMYNSKEKMLLRKACENFIGREVQEIVDQITETLEGHLRAIVGQLTVEEIYQDREKFAEQVRDTARPDLGKMGIEILSFVIQEVSDDNEYLSSIGKARTAEVVKEATIGATNADRDAQIQEAECDQERTDAKMKSDTAIDNAKRGFETTKAECETLINKANTEAKLAYDLQKAKEEQVIRDAELEVEVIKRRI
jgi:flotillin